MNKPSLSLTTTYEVDITGPILQMRRLKFHELESHNKNMSSCQQLLGTCYALGRSLMLYLSSH